MSAAYDEDTLHTWLEGTKKLFTPIPRTISYRCIFLLTDDGQVDLGAPMTTSPAGFVDFYDPGPLVSDDVLQRECSRLAAREMQNRVLPAVREGVPRSWRGDRKE